MPTPSESGTNDKGTCFPQALPLETEVILTTWAEPNKEARSEPPGVGNEFLPCGDMVSLKCGGAGGCFGVEVSSPGLDNDDVGALLRSGAEGLHGGLKLIEKGVRACVKTEPKGNGVEVSQPGDGIEGGGYVVWPNPRQWGQKAMGPVFYTMCARFASHHANERWHQHQR